MSIPVCPLFPDVPGDGKQPPLTLAFASDTSIPQPIVPVLLIHSLKDPFCNNPHCICQTERVQKNAFLLSITRGEVHFHPANRFQEMSEGGKP